MNDAISYPKYVLERHENGSNSWDHLLTFNELLLVRKQRENVCDLQLLNMVSKRSIKLELDAHVFQKASALPFK